jgi:hypothetical protein
VHDFAFRPSIVGGGMEGGGVYINIRNGEYFRYSCCRLFTYAPLIALAFKFQNQLMDLQFSTNSALTKVSEWITFKGRAYILLPKCSTNTCNYFEISELTVGSDPYRH